MATFIKAGFWEKLCNPCTGYKGWLNLDQLIESKIPPIPTPTYKLYRATLSTSGGGDPFVTVLENTLSGTIVWTKNPFATGTYEGTLIGAFPDVNKVHILYNNRVSDDGGASLYDIYLTRGGDDTLLMTTWNGGTPQDDLILASNPLSIEIKVYE